MIRNSRGFSFSVFPTTLREPPFNPPPSGGMLCSPLLPFLFPLSGPRHAAFAFEFSFFPLDPALQPFSPLNSRWLLGVLLLQLLLRYSAFRPFGFESLCYFAVVSFFFLLLYKQPLFSPFPLVKFPNPHPFFPFSLSLVSFTKASYRTCNIPPLIFFSHAVRPTPPVLELFS